LAGYIGLRFSELLFRFFFKNAQPRAGTFYLITLTIVLISQSCVAEGTALNVASPAPATISAPVTPSTAQNQNPPQPQPAVQQPALPVLESTKLLLDFQKTLTDAAKNHQEFLEKKVEGHQKLLEGYYAITAGLLAIIVAIGTGIVAFFHFKSRKDIQELVNARIAATADAEILKVTNLVAEMKQTATTELESFRGLLTPVQKEVANVRITLTEIATLQETLKVNLDRNTKIVTTLSQTWSVLSLPEPPKEDSKEIERIIARRRDVLEELNKIAEWLPTNRHVAIFQGRLHVCLGDLDNAIKVLDTVLERRELDKELRKDADQADLLYNKACYINRKANLEKDKGNTTAEEVLRQHSWKVITESIKLKIANLQEAINDRDLNGLANPSRRWETLTAPVIAQMGEGDA
jgi:hypothetical protein